MRIAEARALPTEQVQSEAGATAKELFNLRFQKATQQLADSNAIRKARKKLARLKTVQRERDLAQQAQASRREKA